MTKFISDLHELRPGTRLALYGAGAVGRYFLGQAQQSKHVEVSCFVDDKKEGEAYGLPVIRPAQLGANNPDLVLITTSYWREAQQQLDALGWKNYAVGDPFHEEAPLPQTVKAVRGLEINCYTPNRVLRFIADAFESIEPKTLDWIDGFAAGETLYDIGASNGMFGIYAALKKKCRVAAFEPDAQNFAVLEMNHFLNNGRIDPPLIALNVAAGERAGLSPFGSLNYGAGHHNKTLQTGQGSKLAHTQVVLTAPLDMLIADFGLPQPDHVKIDVDGAELQVMNGAEQLLSSRRVKSWLIELREHAPETKAILALLEKNGYRLHERQDIAEIIGAPVQGVHNYLFLPA